MPVVEMLNFYATAQQPRWQAIGAEGSDVDVAAVFSDMADFIWYNSDGSSLYANAINDCITKSIGYLMVSVDTDQDHGMGEVVIQNPEPFDVYVDPKSRDMMFKDAAYILIKKLLPKNHLMKTYPAYKAKIKKAAGNQDSEDYFTEKSLDKDQKDFTYKDIDYSDSIDPQTGEHEELVDFYELYEKIKVAYMNVFYRTPPSTEVLKAIGNQVKVKIAEMQQEMEVQLMEQQSKMQEAVQKGDMLEARFELEMKKAQEQMEKQLQVAQQEFQSQLVAEQSKMENMIVSEKEFKSMMKSEVFAKSLVNAVKFYGTRIKQTVVVGDKTLYDRVLPEKITEFPLVPFHFKWTGTPYPISAVSPLIGKQRELNKAHQIMVHNASLGSSLRWVHEEGSIDTDHWEQYSSSPGALLPIRPGSTAPTPIQPAPLSNAFFSIVQEGKGDMEYLAGIYGAMQGDVSAQHETYRGMLAMDEYGTRRVKQWMKNSIEPALKQLGLLVMQYSQSLYTANKVFRVVQPNALQGEKEVEINVPMYNDLGEAVGKFNDYSSAKFDVRIIAGSTLPINRWAYLDELKQLMQLGVIDDIAVLSETDVRNKEKIAQRKSLYSQMQSKIQGMEETLKDKEGTIETLERQLVQAGIKNKVMQAAVEINKEKEGVKSKLKEASTKTEASIKDIQSIAKNSADRERQEQALRYKATLENMRMAQERSELEKEKKDLQNNNKDV
tara:strand:+ start:11 stop:2170 length:2160 start_codon:yes stop_codon:yes gene_type:complete